MVALERMLEDEQMQRDWELFFPCLEQYRASLAFVRQHPTLRQQRDLVGAVEEVGALALACLRSQFIDKAGDAGLEVLDDSTVDGERSIELSSDDFKELEGYIDKVYDRPEREKAAAARKAEQERLDPDRLKAELSRRAKIAGEEYMADNPDGNLDDVALDLGMAALYTFERDEQEELRLQFDNEYDLSLYAAESM